MSKVKKESFFWTSYSDLMTSLFFIMLLLFILTIVLLHNKMVEIDEVRKTTQEKLDKIQEIEAAVNRINPKYFDYNREYKKHVLKIDVKFFVGESDMYNISDYTRSELEQAGFAIRSLIDTINREYPEIQYLLIIEGQASRDDYRRNYELSYERALALRRFWENTGINFGENCEVLISGSGTGGSMRDTSDESRNQRFLIHIIPKPGIIEEVKQQK